jgi:NAD(P)-dependent dehydrogenase (short-subunit alcohol dehydrogenase family)
VIKAGVITLEKTIAVIGGSGFVGRATIELIAKHSARVIVLCRNAEKAKYLKPMGVVGQITLVSGDACDDETLERVIAPADACGQSGRHSGGNGEPEIYRIAGGTAGSDWCDGSQARCRECRSRLGHWCQRNLAQHLFPY